MQTFSWNFFLQEFWLNHICACSVPSVHNYEEPITFQQNSDIRVESNVPYGVRVLNPENRRSTRSRSHHHKVPNLHWDRRHMFDRIKDSISVCFFAFYFHVANIPAIVWIHTRNSWLAWWPKIWISTHVIRWNTM